MIHKETITNKMQKITSIIHSNLDSNFYLAGGTALALLIGHRASIDLDYFINGHIDTLKLKSQITELFPDSNIQFIFEDKDTLWCSIDGVKVSFISRLDILLEKVLSINDFNLAQIKDLTVMKLSAICSREEYKDYFDLACISINTDPRSWSMWWQEVYPNADPISYMIALGAVKDIPKIPLDIKDNFKSIDTVAILEKVTKEISKFS
ncbi:nucleotidyl transferase AbiEii/AbiGii toxin family protein [Candidatus Nomurabacteria bacterium]|nr:nucleotidyl transferase AbiEii/AbiGii toxin family protein [Candidatus Nomurabacteria bacterium]